MHATFTPKSCISAAIESLSEQRACLVAEYDEVNGMPYMRPAIDDTLTIVPGPSLAHRRQHGPGAAERSQQVGGDDRLPGLVGATPRSTPPRAAEAPRC